MNQPDLFPEALADAERELAEAQLYEDDDTEVDTDRRYWFWDDNDYAEQVCIKRHGEL